MTFAQEDDEDVVLEEIVTTGSRIRRDTFNSSSPITVVGGQTILEQGVSNLGEALRELPAVGTGGFNQANILSGGGSTSIDLRNLGSDRVLILINGRRVASFADALQNQAADLSFVPTAMVDRVEILRDGASAVYGSDAITGVVNVILKKDFEGVEASLNTGATSEGDGESYGFSMTMGTSNERSSFVAGVEWRHQNVVKQVDRDWAFPAISALSSSGANNGSFFSPGGVLTADFVDGYCTQPAAFGGDEITDIWPNCPSLQPTQQVTSPDGVQLNRYDYGLQQDVVVPNEVISASLYGNYQLTDSVNAFMEFQYANRQGTTHLDGNPGAAFVPASNPNNPLGTDAVFYIRPTTTVGPRTQDYESATTRIVAGLEGDLPFGNDWFWEASALYTSVNADLVTNYVWNPVRFERISDPDACAADALCSAAVNPSGALDSARPGNWTDQEIRYFRQGAQAVSKFDLFGGMAFVSGSVFELPAGDLNVALGIESRRETGYAKPDSVTESGESIANQTYTTVGAYETDEAFAEIDIPILADMTGFEDLSVNMQYRFTDYSSFGSDDAWRAGLNWQIFDWVRLRGNVSTAYRAPSVTDLYSGGVASFDFFTDVCDQGQSGIQPSSNAYQNCVLDGIQPETFTQIAGQYQVTAGGNPNLQPETADTISYGVVFTPGGWGEGLQIALDVWDIEVTNLVARGDSDAQLDACYNGPVGLTAPECSQFQGRNPLTGEPIDFINFTVNSDEIINTNGYDVSIVYAFDAGPTSWNLSLQGTYVDENTFGVGAGNV
jgi:outer membrane receptor protein involved in Fe transport